MYHSIAIGKGVLHISKLFGRPGSTWPGHLAIKSDRNLIKKVLRKNPDIKIVLIAGTNGKTTTTKSLTHILENFGFAVLTNAAGANLLNGLASILVKHLDIRGKLRHKTLIFEVDENSLPIVLEEIPNPHALILLNLFRDQLDRYGEVNTTAEKWLKEIKKLSSKTLVVANSDDPLIASIASEAAKKIFFTIDNIYKKEKVLSHAVDSIFCFKCQGNLNYSKISYSHIGNYSCASCSFSNPKAKQYDIKTPLLGTYNLYNLTSSVLVADKVFNINPYTSIKALESFKPAFGRQEQIEVDGKKIMLLLSKNPTGFNESLKVALENKSGSLLILLNDRIPDGRDISWIWDVDFEKLRDTQMKIFVSGDRAYDLANRLLFAGVSCEVFEDYKNAYNDLISNSSKDKIITILPTYSAMLEVRKLIAGKSIL